MATLGQRIHIERNKQSVEQVVNEDTIQQVDIETENIVDVVQMVQMAVHEALQPAERILTVKECPNYQARLSMANKSTNSILPRMQLSTVIMSLPMNHITFWKYGAAVLSLMYSSMGLSATIIHRV